MKTVGVTGGIGSGKSSVCKVFAEHGASVFDADSVAKRLMTDDEGIRRELVSAFGPRSFMTDGSLNRQYLADRIFSSHADRRRMNAIVHPAVSRSFKEFAEAARAEGSKLVVKETALLSEIGTEDLDLVVVVLSDADKRIERVAQRDGIAPERIRARIRAQSSESDLRHLADYLIQNDGSLEELHEKTEQVLTEIMASSSG